MAQSCIPQGQFVFTRGNISLQGTQTVEQGPCSGGQCPELVSVEEAFEQHPY